MIADDIVVAGSCNFTESSQRNLERGVRLQRLPADVVNADIAAFDSYVVQSERFEYGIGSRMPLFARPLMDQLVSAAACFLGGRGT